jgi:hypothetical protein
VNYSQKMQSEAYFDQTNTATLESDLAADEHRPHKVQSLQRATTLISFFVGATAVACVLGLVIPYLSQLNSEKPTNVLDWWLRLGGAKPDQTFEKFLHDAAESNQQQWDEMYKNSPAYKFNSSGGFQLNGWQFQPAQNSK